MGDKRRCIFRAKSSDLSVVKQPWNLSNAQTSAPISNKGGLVEGQGGYKGSSRTRGKKSSHINNSGEHDDEHAFIIRVVVNDEPINYAIGEVALGNEESF
jgi:hypothetical protein